MSHTRSVTRTALSRALLCMTALGAAAGAQAAQAVAPELLGAPLAKPAQHVDFEVYLPLRNAAALDKLLEDLHNPSSPKYQQWLTPAQFARQFGPTAQSMARVQAEAKRAGLVVTATHSRSFHVSGQVSQASLLLGTRLRAVGGPGTLSGGGHARIVGETAPVMPTVFQQEGAKVIAFTPLAPRHPLSTHLATPALTTMAAGGAHPDNRYGPYGAYWWSDLKEAYDYPSYLSVLPNKKRLDGTGVNAAVLMADLLFPGDVQEAFDHEHFTTVTGLPAPTVTTVTVDGGGAYNGGGSFEASLDVQQILGGAPGANVTLFSIPDLADDHIDDGYTAIVESNAYDIVNSSFGGCELGYTAAYNYGTDYTWVLQLEHQIFVQGNAQGITFVASSGDEGGLQCPGIGYVNGQPARFIKSVGVPAADPNVTAVGGGNLVTSFDGSLDSFYDHESAFGDPEYPYDPWGLGTTVTSPYWGAGGGVSTIFARPKYQYTTKTGTTTFRTIPDVGMEVGGLGFSIPGFCNGNAVSCDSEDTAVLTAYGVNYGGGNYYTIGTSVSSPEFVGALALYIEKKGKRQGNVNQFLYNQGGLQTQAGGANAPAAKQFYHRGQTGFDGYWTASQPNADYNYIYGNGSPDVRKLFGLTNFKPAGTPKGPTNP